MKPATLYNFSLLLVGANKAKRAEGKSLLSLGVGGGEPAEELQLSSALQKKMQQHVFLSKPEWRGEVEGNKQTNKQRKGKKRFHPRRGKDFWAPSTTRRSAAC